MASPRLTKAKPQTILLVLVVAVGLHGVITRLPLLAFGAVVRAPRGHLSPDGCRDITESTPLPLAATPSSINLGSKYQAAARSPISREPDTFTAGVAAEGGLALVWVDRSDVGFMILGVLGCVFPVGAFIAWRPVIKTLSLQNPKLAKALHMCRSQMCTLVLGAQGS